MTGHRPTNQSHAGNIVFNSVSDLILQGPGPSGRNEEPDTHRPELNGSRALCIDSTPYDKLCPPGKIHPGCRDGATYYNTVSGLTIAVRRPCQRS